MQIDALRLVLMFADHLIEIMGMILAGALIFRLLASTASRRDQIYFKTFSRSVEKTLDADEDLRYVDEHDIDNWLKALTDKVLAQLPDRSLRFRANRAREGTAADSSFRFRNKEAFAEFAEGKRSIVHSIRSHVDVLKSNHPPNFGELADRILAQDRQWKTVGGVPIEIVSRMLDILPGLFVIGGILGTFIGIANGLPMIGKIDMSHINESSPVLSAFIDNIALSMRTSISGIVYSVLMTILNTIFPIHAQRTDVEKSVSRCLEIIWNRIHGDKLNAADARVIELLDQISTQLAGIGTRAPRERLNADAPARDVVARPRAIEAAEVAGSARAETGPYVAEPRVAEPHVAPEPADAAVAITPPAVTAKTVASTTVIAAPEPNVPNGADKTNKGEKAAA